MLGAAIFDVDGVLLALSRDEEEVFFEALSAFLPVAGLPRDWDSYKSRNDDDIIDEILAGAGKPPSLKPVVKQAYLDLLDRRLTAGTLRTQIISQANLLLEKLSGKGLGLGFATANLLGAARLRLTHAGLWDRLQSFAFGADGGGHKRQTLARAIAATGLEPSRIVYVGDHPNDVDAGLSNGVHVIGFSTSTARREKLRAHGAPWVSADHQETLLLIERLLGV